MSVGYFAQKNGKSVSIHEGSASIGGNCRTIKIGDYRFDTGAHRFHDKIPIITEEINGINQLKTLINIFKLKNY